MRIKFFTCFFIAVVTLLSTKAQQALIKGKITDAVNKEALTGATVSLLATNNSTVTDLNGEFFFYSKPGELRFKKDCLWQ